MSDMNKRLFLRKLAGTSLGLAAASVAAPVLAKPTRHGGAPAHAGKQGNAERRRARFPNVPLIDHEGKVARFYDDLVKDKTVLINFMYTRCNDGCPMNTANLKKVQKELGDRVGRDIFMYSLSLEPEHDTREKLAAYAEHFKVAPGWRFLTGTKAHLEQLRQALGFVNPDPVLDKDRTQHIGGVRMGIEPLERWMLAPALANPKYLARYVEWMEPNGKRPDLIELS